MKNHHINVHIPVPLLDDEWDDVEVADQLVFESCDQEERARLLRPYTQDRHAN